LIFSDSSSLGTNNIGVAEYVNGEGSIRFAAAAKSDKLIDKPNARNSLQQGDDGDEQD
jgi:hypothetical protein